MQGFMKLLWAGIFVALTASNSAAQTTDSVKVTKFTLQNGLTVLALEDRSTPAVAYYTVFKVGSRNERPGITGLSHLFEHMMFNGSAKYRPKLFDELIEAGGGSSNAFTTSDTTEYFQEVSSPTLDIVLQLEADRMRALKLDKQNLEQERGIVKEERRVNTDNSISGSMSEILWNNAFVAHPYQWDTIGFMKDLDAIRLEDAKTYFRTYYAPNNAVVCIVGDFDASTLKAKMTRYFRDIPRQTPPRPVVDAEPPQQGERRVTYYRAAELPAVHFGYHIGNNRAADHPALDLLDTILSSGESSRLYKSLVYEKQIAAEVYSSNDARLDPGLFLFYAQAREGKTTAELEAAIYAVLDEIRTKGVTERELQKAKNARQVAFQSRLTTNMGRAGLLAEYEANFGGWRNAFEILPKYDKVTVGDIQRVVKKYFTDRTRTVITLIPETKTDTQTESPKGEKE